MTTPISSGRRASKDGSLARHGLTIGLSALALVVVVGGMTLLWRKLSTVTDDYARLADENRQLRSELSDARSEIAQQRDPWQRPLPPASAPASDVAPEAPPKAPQTPLMANTLVLDQATVTESDGALVTRLQFQPTTTNALDSFALVVRLPRSSEARILGLHPAGDVAYSNAVHRVTGNGLFAIYQADPPGLEPMQFDLTVSEPVTATVRGSNGLDPFEIDIQPTGASVSKI